MTTDSAAPSNGPPEWLDAGRIRASLGTGEHRELNHIRVLEEVDSTNAALLRLPPDERHAVCLLAEQQSAGRGRRGRAWHSPKACNIYLSLGWRFQAVQKDLSFLPLVVALAAATAIRGLGANEVAIKWPNDLVLAGAKLGGCLVEVQGNRGGPVTAVIGVGINVHMRQPANDQAIAEGIDQLIDQPWTSLVRVVPGVSRNDTAAALLGRLITHLQAFADKGFEPLRPAWAALDGLAGRPVLLQHEAGSQAGIARGIGPRGGLMVEADGAVSEHLAGDVSVRSVPVGEAAKPL